MFDFDRWVIISILIIKMLVDFGNVPDYSKRLVEKHVGGLQNRSWGAIKLNLEISTDKFVWKVSVTIKMQVALSKLRQLIVRSNWFLPGSFQVICLKTWRILNWMLLCFPDFHSAGRRHQNDDRRAESTTRFMQRRVSPESLWSGTLRVFVVEVVLW